MDVFSFTAGGGIGFAIGVIASWLLKPYITGYPGRKGRPEVGAGFEDLERDLESAIVWLRSFGLRVDVSRFGQNLKTLREFNRLQRTPRPNPDHFTRLLQETIFVVSDVHELVSIHRYLSLHADSHFLEKVKNLLKGSVREADEGQSTILGRSTGFELMLACLAAGGGAKPDLSGSADVSLIDGNTRINIECKRMQSANNVGSAMADAHSQLARRAAEEPEREHLGVIAVAIGKVTHRGRVVLSAESREAGLRMLQDELQTFADQHKSDWIRASGGKCDLILIYLSAVVEVASTRSFFWAQSLGHFTLTQTSDPRLDSFLSILRTAMAR